MTKVQKIGIGIAAGVVVVGVVLWIVLSSQRSNVPTQQNIAQNPSSPTQENNNTTPTVTPPPQEVVTPNTTPVDVSKEDQQSQVLRLARIIIERYGSFSNRNNFDNIRSLEAFMSDDFAKRSFDYIDANEKNAVADSFYGVSTAAASLELIAYQEDTSAQVRVQTRRVETKAEEETTQLNQSALMDFVFVNGAWKVDAITWE